MKFCPFFTRGLAAALLVTGCTDAPDEGEPVGALGRQVVARYAAGVTFPLGYSNGMGLYLPTSHMLPAGGYEVESYYEYGYPAPLAAGIEEVLEAGLAELHTRGIM